MAMSKLYKLGLLFPFILPLLHHHPVTCSSHAPLFPLNVRLESRDLLATLCWDPVEAAPSGDGGDRPPLVDPFTINSTTTTTTNSTFLNVTYRVQSKLFRRARWQTVCAATTETRCDVSSALDDPGGRYLLRVRFSFSSSPSRSSPWVAVVVVPLRETVLSAPSFTLRLDKLTLGKEEEGDGHGEEEKDEECGVVGDDEDNDDDDYNDNDDDDVRDGGDDDRRDYNVEVDGDDFDDDDDGRDCGDDGRRDDDVEVDGDNLDDDGPGEAGELEAVVDGEPEVWKLSLLVSVGCGLRTLVSHDVEFHHQVDISTRGGVRRTERFIGCRYQHQMMLLPGREDEYCVRVRMVADFPRWKAGEWSPLSCVSVPPPHSTVAPRVGVDTDGQVTAVVGQKVALLRCVLWGAAVVVVQANWLKASRDYVWAGANLATLSPLHGTAYSNSSLAGRLRFHVGGPPGDVSLELLDVRAGDGGLFLCHVATFPHGNYEGRVSLSVIDVDATGSSRSTNVDGTGSSRSTDVDATGSSRSTNVDATGSSRSTHIDATGSSHSTDVDATGSSRSADVDATGSSRSADVDATGSSRSTDVDATGSSRSTDVDATGSSRSTDVDATGSSRSTNVDATGSSRSTDVDATGSSRSTDVDATGSSRSTDVDATGSSPSGDVDATGSSRSTDVDATGSSRSTDVDPTGSSRSTDVDATTAVCCTPVELTTFGPNRQLDTRTGKAAAAGRASWAAPATILGVCLALVATLLLLMPLLYRRRRRRHCRQRRRRHEPWGPTEDPPTLPKAPRRNAEGHRGCLLALESGNKADEGLHGFPPQPLHQDGGAGSYGYAVFTDEDDDEAREEDF
ncbi:uncharacterized protein LOC142910176 [Petromyzon marinus]|uniref:uncharacterized protein LOC142910176 n=1 Tax=Petromyzon marinus TaxID=7757 RepID=UPI003F6E7870